MTCFETGFTKYARECGLSAEEAAHMLKRALAYPAAEQMFRELPTEEEQHSPEELETLSDMLKQHMIDQQLNLPKVHHIQL
jgi:hypothetical protein